MTLGERLRFWWLAHELGWRIKRPWCWIFGHEMYRLPGEYRPRHNTHFCGRCLLFWEMRNEKGSLSM